MHGMGCMSCIYIHSTVGCMAPGEIPEALCWEHFNIRMESKNAILKLACVAQT